MSKMTVTRQFHVRAESRGRRAVRPGPEPDSRVPRVAKLMALAIHFDRLIRDNAVADQAEIARVGRVSRARLTQIMDLLNLAPDIQATLLSGDPTTMSVCERTLRPIAKQVNWQNQRKMWQTISTNT